MSEQVRVEALGVLVDLEVPEPDLAAAVAGAWADATVEVDATDDRPLVTLRVATRSHSPADVTGTSTEEVLHHLSPAVTLAALEARAGQLVLLHAAALADPATGASVVMVAPSGTGKTTATQRLGRHLVYLSDETAAITAEGEVLRYRKPLSLVGSDHLKAQVAASALGLRTDDTSAELRALVLLDRAPEHAGPVRVELVDTVDALALLAPQSSALARTEQPLHRLADVVTRAGGLRVVRYRESADLVPVVETLLGSAS